MCILKLCWVGIRIKLKGYSKEDILRFFREMKAHLHEGVDFMSAHDKELNHLDFL